MALRRLLTLRISDIVRGRWTEAALRNAAKDWQGPHYVRKRNRWLDLLFVTDHLAALVKSNAPLVAGLEEAVSLDAPNSRVEAILLTLREDLAQGASLSESMARRPRFYPAFYVDLVQSGESTGALYASLTQAADGIEHRLTVGAKWKAYLTYIFLVYCVQVLLLAFISLKVVPVFSEILGEFGATIPPSMEFMVRFGNGFDSIVQAFYHEWWWNLTAGVLLLLVSFFAFRALSRTPTVRFLCSAILFYMPIAGRIVVKRDLGRAAFVIEKLLAGGVPLTEAIEKAASMDLNVLVRRSFERMRRRLEQGQSLRDAMERITLPSTYRTILALGEAGETLPVAFREIAELYVRETNKAQSILADVVSPLLIFAAAGLSLLGAASFFQFSVTLVDVMIQSI